MVKPSGVTAQQVYKYERGIDRIPASRLYDFAKLLEVPLSYFYQELRNEQEHVAVRCTDKDRKNMTIKLLLNDEGIFSKVDVIKSSNDVP
jgi:transcriptional regulator with XRE-family HTH domain